MAADVAPVPTPGHLSGSKPIERATPPPTSTDGWDRAVGLSPGSRYDTPTMLFFGWGLLAVVAATTALILQRVELIAVGLPSALILASGLLASRYPAVSVTAELDTPRALEGDIARLTVTLLSDHDVGIVEVESGPMTALEPSGHQRYVVALKAHQPRSVTFAFVPVNWGVVDLPSFTVRARTTPGLLASAQTYRCTTTLRVHINEEPARSQLEPLAFQRVVGSHLSAERGEGCEIADIRPYQQGDRLQAINWRISARTNEPWVTLRHPDRSTSVVIVLDAFGGFGDGQDDTLRRSVRAAMGLARLHLDAQDPVGLMLTGRGRRWIEPQLGMSHMATMTDALLELTTGAWGDQDQRRQPIDRLIPIDSVAIGVSPLLNDAFGQLFKPLLARGQQVHVIEPLYKLPLVISVSSQDDNGDPGLAWRVFELEQQLRRRALTAMGASVSPWSPDEPIESTLVRLRRAQRAHQATVRRPLR